jgi:WD repeat-containing protein 23
MPNNDRLLSGDAFTIGASNSDTIQDILASLFSAQNSESPQQSTQRGSISLSSVHLGDLARFVSVQTRDFRRGTNLRAEEDEEWEDEEEEEDSPEDQTDCAPPVNEAQKEGEELLSSGDFGRIGIKIRTRANNRNFVKLVLNRASHPIPNFHREDLLSNLVPNTNGTAVATYDSNVYTAQFSDDASFYYTCAQDFKLHIFDMRAPLKENIVDSSRPFLTAGDLVTRMPLRKVIQGHPGRWTITDANLSPDNQRMIYSSITPIVYITSTTPDGNDAQIPISFSDPVRRSVFNYGESFGIWSCRFSADGNELVAGGSGKIFVYDLLANKRTVKISAHEDDVNSCCWADTGSGNVLVSASDDTFLKVWDRRSLGASTRPSGVLIGHTEGITYVSAKGDGRYIISNGKDQALRLWDLRKMRSNEEFEPVEHKHFGVRNFDYRYPHLSKPKFKVHPKDCSVMTYRGHSVLRTLIRCHFSPAETTGAQYIYSGSADGKIHIWSLDGRIVHVLDRSKTLSAKYSPSGPEPSDIYQSVACVRDVSWHSQEPVIMSAGWENMSGGTIIARHEYKGLSKMTGGALEDWVEKQKLETSHASNGSRHSSRRVRRHVPGAYYEPDENENIY